ncbi:dTMP kinase [Cutibacterium equinum]|uniref:Thymidylate kinase n=1 Tax=Cutibacterium equinum TaxID=3016342 RepID=A0ABY7R068_9ACTN|nr:dTMP kinase [Cutibacterium equinum]WCC80179.1 dTMP kinase [Cutibacterium equinum]
MTDQQTRTGRDLGGLFIVFEGGDGAGKTTQSRLLDQWLTGKGISHLMTREPGDSWLGQRIRGLVLSPESGEICPRAEALLYNADKAQHVEEVVIPALREGKVVVCDRYIDSTIAYQGAGRILDPDEVAQIAGWATAGLVPDLTVLLDVDPREGAGKIAAKDRVEAAGEEFHHRVRQHFLDLADAHPERYLVLNARASREEISGEVARRVQELLTDEQWNGVTAEVSPRSATIIV